MPNASRNSNDPPHAGRQRHTCIECMANTVACVQMQLYPFPSPRYHMLTSLRTFNATIALTSKGTRPGLKHHFLTSAAPLRSQQYRARADTVAPKHRALQAVQGRKVQPETCSRTMRAHAAMTTAICAHRRWCTTAATPIPHNSRQGGQYRIQPPILYRPACFTATFSTLACCLPLITLGRLHQSQQVVQHQMSPHHCTHRLTPQH